jgi:hypothetical protein
MPQLEKNLSASATLTWWLNAGVAVGAVLMATGGVIALVRPIMLVSRQAQITSAVKIYAGYFAVRNLAIALLIIIAMLLQARQILATLLLVAAFIQVLDAVMDCIEGRWVLVPGVLILSLIFFAASARLSGYPFWRIQAWK